MREHNGVKDVKAYSIMRATLFTGVSQVHKSEFSFLKNGDYLLLAVIEVGSYLIFCLSQTISDFVREKLCAGFPNGQEGPPGEVKKNQ